MNNDDTKGTAKTEKNRTAGNDDCPAERIVTCAGGTGCVTGTAENSGTKRIASGGNRRSTGSSENIKGS